MPTMRVLIVLLPLLCSASAEAHAEIVRSHQDVQPRAVQDRARPDAAQALPPLAIAVQQSDDADGTTITVVIRSDGAGAVDAEVDASVELGSANQRFWAPFDPSTGRPHDGATRVVKDNVVRTAPASRLRLPPNQTLRTSLRLRDLRWGEAKSSLWPDRRLAEVVPPGPYTLVVRVAVGSGASIESKGLPVTVAPH
jgi:hypothetical protein